MKSGLEGRNNKYNEALTAEGKKRVSMKSGLEGRNNELPFFFGECGCVSQ